MVTGELARFGVRDLNDILDPATAEAGIIQAGLDRSNGAFADAAFDGSEARSFMDGEPESVTRAMEESDRAGGSHFGFITALVEYAQAFRVHGVGHDSGFDFAQRGFLSICYGVYESSLTVIRFAAKERACHVAPIAGLKHAREDIDDDEFVRFQRPRTSAMWITGLIATGDNGVGRKTTRLDAGGLDGGADPLAGEGPSIVDEAAALDLRCPQHLLGGGEAGCSASVARTDGLGFVVGFDFTLRKDRAVVDLNVESLIDEFDQNVRREIPGNFELFEFEVAGEGGDLIGRPGDFHAGGLSSIVQILDRDNFIERRFFEGPTELQRIEHAYFLFPDPSGNERIVNFKSTEVAEIQAAVSVVEKNEGRFGHVKKLEVVFVEVAH